MSHDTEAAYAYGEIAGDIQSRAASFFGTIGTGGTWSLSAGREGGSSWPLADGIIQAVNSRSTTATNYDVNIAFEYKRPNEGLHGVLTAIGQAFSYIDKGYDASVICIPNSYSSHKTPGAHAKQVIETNAPDAPIVIYTYDTPNLSAMRPFSGKLTCVRDIDLSTCRKPTRAAGAKIITPSISTVWAHVREGVSYPDAFFRYCQGVKIISSVDEDKRKYKLSRELISAVNRVSPGTDPLLYLSYTTGDSMLDKAWRYVWYNYYFWKNLRPIYKSAGPYVINGVTTKILKDSRNYQQLFDGRSDSIKLTIVEKLNGTFIPKGATIPSPPISVNDAWDEYVKKVHARAHSIREDIDSGLEQLGLIDSDGYLTHYGYAYVNACEKAGNVYDEIPMNILRAITLQLGQYEVFLSTFFKYSNDRFNTNFNDFTNIVGKKTPKVVFDNDPYLTWMHNIFVNQLHILKTTTLRAGGTRKPFQAELAYLKHLGLIDATVPFKIGTGLNINWPILESSMLAFENI